MNIFRRLLKETQVAKNSFIVGFIVSLGVAAFAQLAPLQLQRFIDGPMTDVVRGRGLDDSQMFWSLSLYIGCLLISGVLNYLSGSFIYFACGQIAQTLRNKAYNVLQHLPIAYFDDKPAGKIATQIVNDTGTLQADFYGRLVEMLTFAVEIFTLYLILFFLDWRVGLVLLFVPPIFVVLDRLYHKYTHRENARYFEARSRFNTQINEASRGVDMIQLYHQEATLTAEIDQTVEEIRTANNHVYRVQSLISWPLREFISSMLTAGALAFVGWQFLKGTNSVSVGRMLVYIQYISSLLNSFSNIATSIPSVQRSLEAGKRVFALLDEELEPDEELEWTETAGEVVFDQVSFSYKSGVPVLQNISLQARKGQTIALVGHTGSGKSSIMNLLYRFYDPDEGRILLDGKDSRLYSRESLRRQMGIVLQDAYLFTGTIASNIVMDEEKATDEAIREVLEKVGADVFVNRLPKGIHEPVEEKGQQFSSGERQLIAFARTLFRNPAILILDEATSHIDTETEEMIQRAMEVVKEGRTTFIIAHRLSTIQQADQIVVLDKGRIVEQGTHTELLAKKGIYAQMYHLQQKG